MICYHGTKNENTYKNIVKNGFELYYGNYGKAIYCTSDFNLAKQYAMEDWEEGYGHENLVFKINIPDILIYEKDYNELKYLLTGKKSKNCIFKVAEPLYNLSKYILRNNIKICKINYIDKDEIIILDEKIINIIK